MTDATIVAVARDIRKAMRVTRELWPQEWRVDAMTFAHLRAEMTDHRHSMGLPMFSVSDDRPNVLVLGIPVFAR